MPAYKLCYTQSLGKRAAPPNWSGHLIIDVADPGSFIIRKEVEMGFGISQAQVRTIVEEEVADILAQTNKLAGVAPGESSVPGDWQSGTGFSGETGADLVNIGTAGERKKLHSLVVGIGALDPTATITIKLFMLVNSVLTKVYPPQGTTWTPSTDPNGIWVVTGTLEIDGILRVEVQSDKAADNGKAITYKYNLEDM